ncbi:unnamed protein product [Gordionus sp. m RMFG-2023]
MYSHIIFIPLLGMLHSQSFKTIKNLRCPQNPCKNGGTCFVITESLVPTLCPKGFKSVENGCVKRIILDMHRDTNLGYNWFESRSLCSNISTILFTPTSKRDIKDIENFKFGNMPDNKVLGIWTSGAFLENKWVWTGSSNRSISPSNFHPLFKLNDEKSRIHPCLALNNQPDLKVSNTSLLNLYLSNSDCLDRKQIICQKPKSFSQEYKYQCLCPNNVSGYDCEILEEITLERNVSQGLTRLTLSPKENIHLVCGRNGMETSNYHISMEFAYLGDLSDPDPNDPYTYCHAPQILAIMRKRCHGLANCSLPSILTFLPSDACPYINLASNDSGDPKPMLTLRFSCSDKPQYCHGDHYKYERVCYYFNFHSSALMNWYKARKECAVKGGDLLSLNAIEDIYIEQLLKSKARDARSKLKKDNGSINYNKFWIGLHRIDNIGNQSFAWADGNPSSYRRNAIKSMHPRDGQDCVYMELNAARSDGTIWSSANCDQEYNWICQLPSHPYEKPKKFTKIVSLNFPKNDYDESDDVTLLNLSANMKCQVLTEEGVIWDKMDLEQYSFAPCPDKAQGLAYRICLKNTTTGRNIMGKTVYSQCVKPIFSEINKMMSQNLPAFEISSSLLNSTKDMSGFRPVDLQVTSVLLNDIIRLQEKQLMDRGYGKDEKKKISKKFMNSIGSTSSKLIDPDTQGIWNTMNNQEKTATLNQIISSIDKNVDILAQHNKEKSEFNFPNIIIKNDMVSGLKDKETWNFNSASDFSKFKSAKKEEVSVNLFSQLIEYRNPEKNKITPRNYEEFVSFVAFNNLNNLFDQARLIKNDPNHMGETKGDNNYKYSISHPIISNESVMVNIAGSPKASQILTISYALDPKDTKTYRCAFWNVQNKNNLHWDDHGCTTKLAEKSRLECQCNHTTSFSVLTDYQSVLADLIPINTLVLDLITNVGLVVSIICLGITFAIFVKVRALHTERNVIHKNMCLCLMFGEIIFLSGINFVHNKLVCKLVALLLHYFFQATFMWILLEGVYLFVLLKNVFDDEKSYKIYYYLVGYGIPGIIVGASYAIMPSGYGTAKHCWLSTEKRFIWAFLGPVLAVILSNIFILIYSLLKVMQIKAPSNDKTGRFWKWLKGSFLLLCILGITWLFGFMFISYKTLLFAYIFCLLNSFQGLFIFIFHIYMNEKTRMAFLRYLRRSSFFGKHFKPLVTSSVLETSSGKPFISKGPYFLTNFSMRGFKPLSNTSEVAEDSSEITGGRYKMLLEDSEKM